MSIYLNYSLEKLLSRQNNSSYSKEFKIEDVQECRSCIDELGRSRAVQQKCICMASIPVIESDDSIYRVIQF